MAASRERCRVESTHSRLYGHFLAGLRAHRKAIGVTQKELAARLKNRQSFVSKVERGERRIDIAEFVEILIALKCDPVHFLRKQLDGFDAATLRQPKPRIRNR